MTGLRFNAPVDVKVKICGITSVADAEAAVAAGADALGLMFFPGSNRFISLERAQEIARVLPPHILRTGVFADPNPADVVAAIQHCQLNLLQFHGSETPEFCRQFGLMTMKAFRIRDAESLLPMSDYHTDAFLLDSHVAGKPGGTGETFNWDLALAAKKFGKPIFLAGGLTPDNVAAAVRKVQPFGVDVSSGVEQSPGKKDVKKMRDFINAVRGACAGMNKTIERCPWPKDDLYVAYHDTEWGVPLHDDRALFEYLILEGAQAGLSWHTVLKKRANYRAAFDHFDAEKIARYTPAKIKKLLANPGLIRNRLKIDSAVRNARAFLAVRAEFGSFDRYLWRFVEGRPLINHHRSMREVPARTSASDAMSKDLKQRGFNFVGSTICYAHMQATGMVNDHLVHCFRHRELGGGLAPKPLRPT